MYLLREKIIGYDDINKHTTLPKQPQNFLSSDKNYSMHVTSTCIYYIRKI